MLERASSFSGSGRLRLASLLIPLCLTASIALADTPAALPKYAGNYAYAGTREQGIAVVEKAFEQALSEMNMVMRAMMKHSLSDRFADTIIIEVSGGKLGIKVGEAEKATQELDKTQTVKSPDGKQSGKLTYKFDGTKITTTLVGDEGTATTVFSLTADGKTLQRDTTMTSKRLKKPVSYRLLYKRK